jgi:hypothetical protein
MRWFGIVLLLVVGNICAVACAKKRTSAGSELQMVDRDTDILSEEELEEFPESK